MSLVGLATKLFGWIPDRYPNFFSRLKSTLPKSGIVLPFRSYISLCFFIPLITTAIFSIGILLIHFFFKLNFFQKLITLVSIPVCFFASLVFLMFYPEHKAISRARNIETNLPFVLMHMGAVSESGVPPYIIFKLISRFKEYGEISNEMGKIVRNIEKFGMDPLTAMKNVASKTPSEKLRQLLEGLVTTTESGGNVTYYLKNVGEQALFEWRTRRQRFIQQLSTYAEIYTGLVIAAPLFIVSLFAVLSLIQPEIGGLSILELTTLSVYGIIPGINLLFLLFLKGMEVEM